MIKDVLSSGSLFVCEGVSPNPHGIKPRLRHTDQANGIGVRKAPTWQPRVRVVEGQLSSLVHSNGISRGELRTLGSLSQFPPFSNRSSRSSNCSSRSKISILYTSKSSVKVVVEVVVVITKVVAVKVKAETISVAVVYAVVAVVVVQRKKIPPSRSMRTTKLVGKLS